MTTPNADEIRVHVAKAYASRVNEFLSQPGDELDVVQAEDPCCGPATESGDACCAPGEPAEFVISNIKKLYEGADTADLPGSVTDVAFGCGNPTAIDALQPGETVLDLGSGGGIDCFLAAKMVGPTGQVYGVDMTPEMVSLARANATKVGATNVEFRLGEIEHLPIPGDTVDVIISNCVINLSPDKDQVFREAFRVLRPGGRLQVSDIVWTRPVDESTRQDMEQWASCIAGALLESDYLDAIRAAGFVEVSADTSEYEGGNGVASAAVFARKPGGPHE